MSAPPPTDQAFLNLLGAGAPDPGGTDREQVYTLEQSAAIQTVREMIDSLKDDLSRRPVHVPIDSRARFAFECLMDRAVSAGYSPTSDRIAPVGAFPLARWAEFVGRPGGAGGTLREWFESELVPQRDSITLPDGCPVFVDLERTFSPVALVCAGHAHDRETGDVGPVSMFVKWTWSIRPSGYRGLSDILEFVRTGHLGDTHADLQHIASVFSPLLDWADCATHSLGSAISSRVRDSASGGGGGGGSHGKHHVNSPEASRALVAASVEDGRFVSRMRYEFKTSLG